MDINPITVAELNSYIKEKIESDEYLMNVYVKGEISNFKRHYTGHLYFTIKDDTSAIKCVMFRTNAENLAFDPEDGMKVRILGKVAVYERDGAYQLYPTIMQQDGLGALYAEYEALKEKLKLEGLFDEDRKKPIPINPKIIGVLSSKTGSVIHDIINVSTRRNPNVYIRLYPVPVQGQGAGCQIADAIRVMNEKNLADVLIIARGGGSIEDLWPFNEEVVARAIASSTIPVISAVGHETDFTIADFVADLRCPTPSAAAESATANVSEVYDKLSIQTRRLIYAIENKLEKERNRIDKCMSKKCILSFEDIVKDKILYLENLETRMQKIILDKYNDNLKRFDMLLARLNAISPLATLKRGYTLISKNNALVRTKADVKVDDEIDIKLIDATIKAKVIDVINDK